MQLLLDTHAFIWFYTGDKQLSSKAKTLINDLSNECFLSIASVWEIGIKTSIGKLELRVNFTGLADFMATNRIVLLLIAFRHIQRLQSLPFHHRDTFDRLLIAQAFAERLTLISRDGFFQQYDVPLIW